MTTAPYPVVAIEISNAPSLDPIRVFTTDFGPGQGRIIFECYGCSWSSYWGGMGRQNIRQFFITASADYLAERLRTQYHKMDKRAETYLKRIITAIQEAFLTLEKEPWPLGLWCVHTSGIDAVQACHSKEIAETLAAEWNEQISRKSSDDPNEPQCRASAQPWPHSPEQHANELKRLLLQGYSLPG